MFAAAAWDKAIWVGGSCLHFLFLLCCFFSPCFCHDTIHTFWQLQLSQRFLGFPAQTHLESVCFSVVRTYFAHRSHLGDTASKCFITNCLSLVLCCFSTVWFSKLSLCQVQSANFFKMTEGWKTETCSNKSGAHHNIAQTQSCGWLKFSMSCFLSYCWLFLFGPVVFQIFIFHQAWGSISFYFSLKNK